MASRVTLDQLHTQLDRYWDEDGLGNKPEGSLKRYLARLDGEDLVEALNKSIGCDCCADSDFYRIRGSLIKELVRRAGIKVKWEMTQEAEALGMIVAELREIRLALTAPQEGEAGGALAHEVKDLDLASRMHSRYIDEKARAERAEAKVRELTADNLHLCHKVATLETKLADVEAELKLERYRKSEQIRDKHRILDEYEVKVQALEAKLAAVRACPRGTLAGYEVIRADALDRALATGDNASTPPDHAAEEVK